MYSVNWEDIMMKRINKYIYVAMMMAFTSSALAETTAELLRTDSITVRDSTVTDPENTYENALQYMFQTKTKPLGEEFKKHTSHLFLEAGVGLEETNLDLHETMYPLTTFFASLGKQLDRRNAVRLTASLGNGYTKDLFERYMTVGLSADYIRNLSSTACGYDTDRTFELSFFAGAGMQYEKYCMEGENINYNVRGGLQLKLQSGPHGAFALEPYVDMLFNNFDCNQQWRPLDFGFGARLNYIYYFDNYYSPAAKLRHPNKERWRAPLFFEVANGVTFNPELKEAPLKNMGHSMSLTAGLWFSPVIGAKGGLTTSETALSRKSGNDEKTMYYETTYVTGKLLFNPFGLSKNFTWNDALGAYVFFGGGIGLWGDNDPWERSFTELYLAGVHLSAKLTNDLSVFLEPNWTWANTTNMRKDMTTHRSFAIDLGLTMNVRGRAYRKTYEDTANGYGLSRWTIGAGGGWSISHKSYTRKGESDWSGGALLFGEYMFNNTHGVRLASELMCISEKNCRVLMPSICYVMNASNLLTGYNPSRRMNVDVFVGPALGMVLDADEEQEVKNKGIQKGDKTLAALLGVKLYYYLTPKISAFVSPTFYVFNKGKILPYTNLRRDYIPTESLNLGIQWHF